MDCWVPGKGPGASDQIIEIIRALFFCKSELPDFIVM